MRNLQIASRHGFTRHGFTRDCTIEETLVSVDGSDFKFEPSRIFSRESCDCSKRFMRKLNAVLETFFVRRVAYNEAVFQHHQSVVSVQGPLISFPC